MGVRLWGGGVAAVGGGGGGWGLAPSGSRCAMGVIIGPLQLVNILKSVYLNKF